MKMNKTVCNCYRVTVGDIAKVIQDGAKSFEEVQAITHMSTCCGACEEYARNVTAELLSENTEHE